MVEFYPSSMLQAIGDRVDFLDLTRSTPAVGHATANRQAIAMNYWQGREGGRLSSHLLCSRIWETDARFLTLQMAADCGDHHAFRV